MGGAYIIRGGPTVLAAQDRIDTELRTAYKLGLIDLRGRKLTELATLSEEDRRDTISYLQENFPEEEGRDAVTCWVIAVHVHS